jgi:thiol-disulfide isomerase/thioredoxin
MRLLRTPPRRAVVAAAVASTVLAACGGGGNDIAGSPSTTRPPTSDAPTGDANETAAAFTQVLTAATPLDGTSFDATTLAGADAVIWFWAPWCTICRGEAPEVAEIR